MYFIKEDFYKNIYDLYWLINTYNDLESFKVISLRIKESLSIDKKERCMVKRELKEKIISKDSLLNLKGTGNVLRLLYLDHILSEMRPSFLKTSKLT
jgi:hypothetical protein